MPERAVEFSSLSHLTAGLAPSPINQEWILEGAPKAHGAVISRSADESAAFVLWTCTAGKFRWVYNLEETLHILEGSAVIDDGNGSRRLGPGDFAFFPAGSTAVWTVDKYVRKVAFCRRTLPAPIGIAVKLARAVKSIMRRERRKDFPVEPANIPIG